MENYEEPEEFGKTIAATNWGFVTTKVRQHVAIAPGRYRKMLCQHPPRTTKCGSALGALRRAVKFPPSSLGDSNPDWTQGFAEVRDREIALASGSG